MPKQGLVDQAIAALKNTSFDTLAIAKIDFEKGKFSSYEVTKKKLVSKKPFMYFDLASITKPLTLASCRLIHPELFDQKKELLLNHRAGLPSGGRLSRLGWREQILGYKIKESETLYSDYSALRLMLELEKKSGKSLKKLVSDFWDKELVFWTELPKNAKCPATGERGWTEIKGVVNDDNAFVINEFCSHAGLFSTIGGLCRTLLNLDKKHNLLSTMDDAFSNLHHDYRYVMGWDRVQDPSVSHAGSLASLKTFGHLGFTGTSVWIDLEKRVGAVILSNSTQKYYYNREEILTLRRTLGDLLFS